MRKVRVSIDNIKQQVNAFKGLDARFEVNLGRNKFYNFEGKVDNIYPSLFTVAVNDGDKVKTHSYSYSDVLCGQVKLSPLNV